jgi:hypothetical protein
MSIEQQRIYDYSNRLYIRSCILTDPILLMDYSRVRNSIELGAVSDDELYWRGDAGKQEINRRKNLER